MVPLMVSAIVINEPKSISFKLISIISIASDIDVTFSLIITMVSEKSTNDILSITPDNSVTSLIIFDKSIRGSKLRVSKKANIFFRNKSNL